MSWLRSLSEIDCILLMIAFCFAWNQFFSVLNQREIAAVRQGLADLRSKPNDS